MIYDLRSHGQPLPHYDLCIVGTGVAGQVLFGALRDAGFRLALIESGDRMPDAETQSLRELDSTGLNIDIDSRERYLGGNTNTWGFACVPHDEIDFEPRAWVPYSGWPFRMDTTAPYFDRAADLLQIPRPVATRELLSAERKKHLSLDDDTFESTHVVKTPCLDGFAPTFEDELSASSRHDLYLNANVVDIRLDENGERVSSLTLSPVGGKRTSISADRFILACGGIENARLLLLSHPEQGAGIGIRGRAVGRFFMEHPKGFHGTITLAQPRAHIRPYQAFRRNGVRYVCGVRLTARAQAKHRLLNCAIRLAPKSEPARPGPSETVTHVEVKNFMEMAPNPDNRITLAPARDALGLPRAIVTCRPSELDMKTLVAFHRLLAARLQAMGLGRLDSDLATQNEPTLESWPITGDASHHMGATRMGLDPSTSVVNADARLHEVHNLYIAGSSVFPTCGHSNPTLTIVALCLRLADHLRRRPTESCPPTPRATL